MTGNCLKGGGSRGLDGMRAHKPVGRVSEIEGEKGSFCRGGRSISKSLQYNL